MILIDIISSHILKYLVLERDFGKIRRKSKEQSNVPFDVTGTEEETKRRRLRWGI